MPREPGFPPVLIFALSVLAAASTASGQTVTFREVAGPSSGLQFERVPSARHEVALDLYLDSVTNPVAMADLAGFPANNRGIPGVVVFDFDQDGDPDIYVTNGPGAPNGLFTNQWLETGTLTFVDVAQQAGVAATAQDSTGACAGDLDNDGDLDLIVVGDAGPYFLFENLGDGTFQDATGGSGLDLGGIGATTCSLADVNNDGLLDLAVAHTFNYDSLMAIMVEPYALNLHNELFLNLGQLRFQDVSATSGIQALDGMPPGAAGISWALSFADHDLDGDADLFVAEDQGVVPMAKYGGVDRGFLQVYENDGTGQFTAVSQEIGTLAPGSWMGFSFADYNQDGALDFFCSNVGDYLMPFAGLPFTLGDHGSRWWLGSGTGSFTDPGVGALIASVFGWGTASQDFDNDGDVDILYHGALDVHFFMEKSNAGALLLNDGNAGFTLDPNAFETEHSRRHVKGVATGDFNLDGFLDIVSVSSQNFPEPIPLVPFPFGYGSPFDPTAFFVPSFAEVAPGLFSWIGTEFPNGGPSVEINNGETGHGSLRVIALGSAGLTEGGAVNRSGVGAVITVTPSGLSASMKPVVAGGSFVSQEDLAQVFGLRHASSAKLDVLWPGGVRNRLYGALPGETLVFPEIPCSYDDPALSLPQYAQCVRAALRDLRQQGILDGLGVVRFGVSALIAYFEHH